MRFGRLALLAGLGVFAAATIYVFAYRTDGDWAESSRVAAAQIVAQGPDSARTSKPADDKPGQPVLSEEERAVRYIGALVATGDIGRARDAAEDFLRRYPTSGYCQHIETLTGVHPRPPIPGE